AGRQAGRELARLLPVGCLAGDRVPFLLQHLLQVKPDQRLVFGDHNADGCRAHSQERTQGGRLASVAPLPSSGDGESGPGRPIGRVRGLKHRAVWVRIPPGALERTARQPSYLSWRRPSELWWGSVNQAASANPMSAM